MVNLQELILDPVKMNTDLAEDFLKGQRKILSIGNDQLYAHLKRDFKVDMHGVNIIFNTVDTKLYDLRILSTSYELSIQDYCSKLRKLALKIADNSELFCQLEYKVRKIPVNQTKAEIVLVMKHIQYSKHLISHYHKLFYGNSCIFMTKNEPLLKLGLLFTPGQVCFNITAADKETALVSHLFVKLCHEAGLTDVQLILSEDYITKFRGEEMNFITEKDWSSLGVITEKSDLDSALDVFLSSTTKALWSLDRVMVQESVYEAFKDCLKFKSKHTTVSSETQDRLNSAIKLSADFFYYEDKLFLFDYAGPENSGDQELYSTPRIVKVEAYRTTDELLSLIKKYNHRFISLWSCDNAEANRIALNVAAIAVWINDYATFDGPPKVSQTVFSQDYSVNVKTICHSGILNDGDSAPIDWFQLTEVKRKEILLKALNDWNGNDEKISTLVKKILSNIEIDNTKFVDITDSLICIGIDKPIDIVNGDIEDPVSYILSTLKGNRVVFPYEEHCPYRELYNILIKTGLPIKLSQMNMDCVKIHKSCYYTKVIWNRYN